MTTASGTEASGGVESIRDELAECEATLWLIVLATFTLDVYLTYLGIRHGLAEGNPVMAMGFETFGFAVLGLTKAVALGVAGFYRELRPADGPFVALGLSLPWLVAVIVNATVVPLF